MKLLNENIKRLATKNIIKILFLGYFIFLFNLIAQSVAVGYENIEDPFEGYSFPIDIVGTDTFKAELSQRMRVEKKEIFKI